MKLIVFSICKNEEATIGEVLDRIPPKIKGISEIEKLVVSDGSSDNTADVARRHGAIIIEGIQQKRLAYRFQQAIDKCLELGADIAVNIDGDLQFMPEDIPKLVAPIPDEGYDFVAADRFTDPKSGQIRRPANMPFNKYLANRFGAWVVGKLSGDKFNDVTCGFRAYNRSAMLALNLNSKYTYTQESFQVLARKRKNIKAVPVDVKYYKGRKSRVVNSFTQFLFGSAINILRASRDFAPLSFFLLLGVVPFILGLIGMIFTGIYWLNTGQITPFKGVGIAGIYLFTLGVVIWIVGLVADMLDRSLSNQEKILENIKKIRYEKE